MDAVKIYVASPLGFSESGRFFLYEKIVPMIEDAGYSVLDPWKLTPEEVLETALSLPLGPEKEKAWIEANRIIGGNNAHAIEESSGLFAVLDGVDVDSGTAAEIGYAAGLKKPILGYRSDFRLAGDNIGARVNLQVEYFIRNSGGYIIKSVDDLRGALVSNFW